MCLFAAIVLSSAIPIALEDLSPEYELIVLEEAPESSGISKRSLQRELDSPLTGSEKITKRSLKTDFGTPLTGMEKITKRSLKTEDGLALTGIEKISKRSADEPEDVRIVFLPSLSKHRTERSAKFETDVLDSNDVFKREKRQLFLPGFARRRVGRSVDGEDMETAESAVFLPGFARRG